MDTPDDYYRQWIMHFQQSIDLDPYYADGCTGLAEYYAVIAFVGEVRYPQGLRGVMILDAAFPSLNPWHDILGHPAFWHVRFHQTELPALSSCSKAVMTPT